MKHISIFLLSILLFTNCATILNTPNQKVEIKTDSENTVYINGEEPRQTKGKYLVKRDFNIKQVTVKREGYKSVNVAVGQYSKHWLYIVSWVPFGACFLIPPLVDYGPKAYDYPKTIKIEDELKSFPKKDSTSKEIHFRKIGVSLDAEDNRFRYFSSYADYKNHHYYRNSSSDDEAETISLGNTIFSDNLNDILGENGYIDTTRKILKNSYLNNLYVEANIKEYTLHQISHKQSGFYYVDIMMNYKIQDYYGDSIYGQNIETTSGQFIYKKNRQSLRDKSIDKAIKDALEFSMISFFENPIVDSLLHDKSQLMVEQEFDTLNLTNQGRFVSNINEAINSTVTVTTEDGHGSGFIVSDNGYIVTNYHVINDTNKLQVVLHNGNSFNTEVIRVSKIHDLALLKIDTTSLLPFQLNPAKEITIANEVYAVGTPSGEDLSQSVTKGIISGIRKIENGSELIQTDASVNGGNSGGVLIDKNGLVIGVVSSKLKGFSIEGVAFGIPAYVLGDKFKIVNSFSSDYSEQDKL